MKRIIAALLALTLCLPMAHAAGNEGTTEEACARGLYTLGLFNGVGSNADGSPDFDLGRAPSRAEAVTMLVRALGGESEAAGLGRTHPFTDVPVWADGYVSYAYAHGLTKGVSETEFGADTLASCAMYLTFMLRALGYTEGEDFSWDQPFLTAHSAGIFPLPVDWQSFTRGDVARVTAAALHARVKGGEQFLYEKLEDGGAFMMEELAAAFPSDPFAWEKRVDGWVEAAMEKEYPTGQNRRNTVSAHAWLPLAYERTDSGVIAHVHRCEAYWELGEDNSFRSGGMSAEPDRLEFDAAGNLLSITTSWTGHGLTEAEYEAFREAFGWMLENRAKAAIEALIAGGQAGYRKLSHDEALAERLEAWHSEEEIYETEHCTVLLWMQGGVPSGPFTHIYLIYKPGSLPGDGTVIDLPTIARAAMHGAWPPDTLALSEDGEELTYSYTFDDRVAFPARVLHEAGTYTYTVKLRTGRYDLRLDHAPTPAGEGTAGKAYDEALKAMTAASLPFVIEETWQAPTCTVLKGATTGTPHGAYAGLKLVFKQGAGQPEGTVVDLPMPITDVWGHNALPETAALSEDGGRFTYTYFLDKPSVYVEELRPIRTETYTVDLFSGESGEEAGIFGYAEALAYLTQGGTVEKQLETGKAAVVLFQDWREDHKGYRLYLLDKATGAVKQLLLPSTAGYETSPGAWDYPTMSPPDSMELSADGKTLTYTYRFDQPLQYEWTGALHEVGTYTYTVDMATGALSAVHTPQ